MKETIRVGLKFTKSYNAYECTIEKEINYETLAEREDLVTALYSLCRKDISKQMEIGKVI